MVTVFAIGVVVVVAAVVILVLCLHMCGQREGAVAVSVVLLQSEVKWEKKGSHTAESCEPVGLRVGEDLEGHGRAFCLN
jgi:hypothetical protein